MSSFPPHITGSNRLRTMCWSGHLHTFFLRGGGMVGSGIRISLRLEDFLSGLHSTISPLSFCHSRTQAEPVKVWWAAVRLFRVYLRSIRGVPMGSYASWVERARGSTVKGCVNCFLFLFLFCFFCFLSHCIHSTYIHRSTSRLVLFILHIHSTGNGVLYYLDPLENPDPVGTRRVWCTYTLQYRQSWA